MDNFSINMRQQNHYHVVYVNLINAYFHVCCLLYNHYTMLSHENT